MKPRVFFICLAVIMFVIVLFLLHQKGSKDTLLLQDAVNNGLMRIYDRLTIELDNNAGYAPEKTTQVLQDELGRHRVFPGFSDFDEIFIPTKTVTRGTTNLLWVIQPWTDLKYGVDGNGHCRKVGDAEFQNWPHTTLQK